MKFFISQIVFKIAKLIKHMLNSLSGAGRLVLKKEYKLNLTNIKYSNNVSKIN